MITIFTPTYNCKNQLWTLFRSLESQTCKDFEWLIVDDGSKDGTMGIVERFQSLTYQFSLRYFYQKHGGKHRAINRGIKEAQGELFFIVNATDKIPPFCIETIKNHYRIIRDNDNYAGVHGNVHYTNGSKATDRSAFAYKIKVLHEFHLPEFEGEYYCPDNILTNRINSKYKLYYFNEYIYTTYALSSSKLNICQHRNSPNGSAIYFSELYHNSEQIVQKINASVNFWRFLPTDRLISAGKFNMMTLLSLTCFLPGRAKRILDSKYCKCMMVKYQ